jgi:phosphoribosyl-ATP pyrophosphohydrolase/phosphoribosyl-AMP cyclohydrolase
VKIDLSKDFVEQLKFNSHGLIPAIVQEVDTGEVLMLAYQNREALLKTLETGTTWFYSRSRQELWHKGATSGHYQEVQAIYYDCDADTVLMQVRQAGAACHKGYHSCFHNRITPEGVIQEEDRSTMNEARRLGNILGELAEVIEQRKAEMPEGSYTTYLFNKGLDKILKKVGEEASEVIIASKNEKREEIVYEVSDLIYHLLVLLAQQEVDLGAIAAELAERRK